MQDKRAKAKEDLVTYIKKKLLDPETYPFPESMAEIEDTIIAMIDILMVECFIVGKYFRVEK